MRSARKPSAWVTAWEHKRSELLYGNGSGRRLGVRCDARPRERTGVPCRRSRLDTGPSLESRLGRQQTYRTPPWAPPCGAWAVQLWCTQYGTCTHCTHRTMRATLKSKAGCGSRIVYAFYIHIRLVVCEPRSRRLTKLKRSVTENDLFFSDWLLQRRCAPRPTTRSKK